MPDDSKIHLISTSEDSCVDVVFIHGLTGDSKKTWSNGELNGFWPAWLQSDVEEIAVYSLGYPAHLLRKPFHGEMDIYERSKNVLEQLADFGIGNKPIVFVSHSLGGILVKTILRKSSELNNEDWSRVAEATQLVFFIATPHFGSDLTSVSKVIPYTSKYVEVLTNRFGGLEDLNEHYRAFAISREHLITIAYYETHPTKGVVVVSRESADPGVGGTFPIPIDRDHVNICKPVNREDRVYMGVMRRVRDLVKEAKISVRGERNFILAERYDQKSPDDRRDLLQKLIESDREHEYHVANNAQNKFARTYTKTGLFTTAREDHDNLLSEVETRFLLHVYHPLICQAASEDSIAAAIQDQIIEPLSSKRIGGTKYDAKSIYSALYFLTEQCHIRWDVPQ